tara:strand:- start:50 stop:1036 length:987 start_codon:yes stop_codon:yes gene_type:complete
LTAHSTYINRCLQLAEQGRGKTTPNPLVGCVIVNQQNTIIAEGYHEEYGHAHAEINALNKVPEETDLSECTMYVNLEPCSHFGKTPPCCEAIIKSTIKKVVIGMKDPNQLVAGKGIEKLKQNNIEVIVPVNQKKCELYNRQFLHYLSKKRPYVILKWAESFDGIMAPSVDKYKKISNEISQILVHKLRSEVDAILVGSNTIIDDNPLLNTRFWHGKSPQIFVLDPEKKVNKSYNIFQSAKPPFVIQSKENNLIQNIFQIAEENNIYTFLVEGGPYTISQFSEKSLWDEAFIIKSENKIIEGLKSPHIVGEQVGTYTIGDNYINHILAL